MAEAVTRSESERRLEILKEDIRSGKIRKDILLNSAFKFEGETRAMYYSNARKNLQTDVAEAVMKSNQQLNDLEALKIIKGFKCDGN